MCPCSVGAQGHARQSVERIGAHITIQADISQLQDSTASATGKQRLTSAIRARSVGRPRRLSTTGAPSGITAADQHRSSHFKELNSCNWGINMLNAIVGMGLVARRSPASSPRGPFPSLSLIRAAAKPETNPPPRFMSERHGRRPVTDRAPSITAAKPIREGKEILLVSNPLFL